MRVLLDHMVPHGLRHAFTGHEVQTAAYRGWSALTNGQLLEAAQAEFDVIVTLDDSVDRQQVISRYALALVVLCVHPATEENFRSLLPECLRMLNQMQPGRVYRFARGD